MVFCSRITIFCLCYFFFFFNAPAPPEIYPYCHTLSLHAALPISGGRAPDGRPAAAGRRADPLLGIAGCHPAPCPTPRRAQRRDIAQGGLRRGGDRRDAARRRHPRRPARGVGHGSCRSEEHTSELQSLMRISYAVFCLKKKT